MTKTLAVCGLTFFFSLSSIAQIAQSHPELCGSATSYLPVPQNISATTDSAIGVSTLTLAVSGSKRSIVLPGGSNEIQQVCELPDNRLAIFAWYIGEVYTVTTINQVNGEIVDSVLSYNPVISPDRHWMVMRAFYPLHTDIPISEQYLVYDLRGTAATNRHGAKGSQEIPGWAVYPSVTGNVPIDPLDVPDSQIHRFRSKSFYWAPDSRSIVFADSVGTDLSLILVSEKGDKFSAYEYPITPKAVCGEVIGEKLEEPNFTLTHAELNSVVITEFQSDVEGCSPRQLSLNVSDFKRAPRRVYEPRKLKVPTGSQGHKDRRIN